MASAIFIRMAVGLAILLGKLTGNVAGAQHSNQALDFLSIGSRLRSVYTKGHIRGYISKNRHASYDIV
jgi:hypothetical protein